MSFFIALDTPEEYWCKIPELENLTATQRKFLAIPLIDVSKFIKIDLQFMFLCVF
jgi:hypothetical protein